MQMKKKNTGTILALGFIVLLWGGCRSVSRIPSPGRNTSDDNGKKNHYKQGNYSSLLPPKRLKQMASSLFSDCKRFEIAPFLDGELLIGYEKREQSPTHLASLSRVGDKEGNMVLGVGVVNDGKKIYVAGVETMDIAGKLPDIEVYLKEKNRFLSQFKGRPTREGFHGVDAITGATPISVSLRDIVQEEAKKIADLFQDKTHLSSLLSRASRLADGSPYDSQYSSKKDKEGKNVVDPAGIKYVPAGDKEDWTFSEISFLIELFLFSAVVSLVAWRELKGAKQ
jgi:hypothetical protein